MFQNDPEVQAYLPINTEDDSLYDVLADGVILCKFLRSIEGSKVDYRYFVIRERAKMTNT